MNKKILTKVIDELAKDKPDISYVRGILETLVESLPQEKVIWNPETQPLIVSNHLQGELKNPVINSDDEGAILDMKAKAMMGKVDTKSIEIS